MGAPAPLTARWVDPRTVQELATFTVGGASSPELEVDQIVHDLHAAGILIPIRLTTAASDEIAGLCLVNRNPLGTRYPDAAYVAVIAVAAGFRGQRVGDFLLHDALQVVSKNVGPMPAVWAMIDPANGPSHRLFERHGFADVVPANSPPDNLSHYDWRIRAPGLPI